MKNTWGNPKAAKFYSGPSKNTDWTNDALWKSYVNKETAGTDPDVRSASRRQLGHSGSQIVNNHLPSSKPILWGGIMVPADLVQQRPSTANEFTTYQDLKNVSFKNPEGRKYTRTDPSYHDIPALQTAGHNLTGEGLNSQRSGRSSSRSSRSSRRSGRSETSSQRSNGSMMSERQVEKLRTIIQQETNAFREIAHDQIGELRQLLDDERMRTMEVKQRLEVLTERVKRAS
jgi:hypothetical protein